ncbi:MAG TPA: methyltransferase domain-containing protein [Allosphingosinicella sp.]|jgi:SAM-dependent methyltransferase
MMIKSKVAAVGALVRALSERKSRSGLFRWVVANEQLSAATCPCCGFTGKFLPTGTNMRLGQLCPSCGSRERHRLFALALERGFVDLKGRDVLHFAPERGVQRLVAKAQPRSYTTADLEPGRADKVLNLEQIDLPDHSCGIVIASHVLEHVDDRRALTELFRILEPGGQLIAMVPIVEGWSQTFEDPALASREERARYFGRYDHVRFYGSDFRDRVTTAGFELAEFTAGPVDSVQFRLSRGEKVFTGTRPRTA